MKRAGLFRDPARLRIAATRLSQLHFYTSFGVSATASFATRPDNRHRGAGSFVRAWVGLAVKDHSSIDPGSLTLVPTDSRSPVNGGGEA
jgi:hypothetical protein